VSYSLSAGAEADLAEAVAFYRERASDAIARAFLEEFVRAARVVEANPGLGTPTLNGRRIFPLRRFPFSLIYRTVGGELRISVVAHQQRKPGFWKSRG